MPSTPIGSCDAAATRYAGRRGRFSATIRAVELTRPQLGEAGEDVPVTVVSSVVPLPDEPQALDFGARP